MQNLYEKYDQLLTERSDFYKAINSRYMEIRDLVERNIAKTLYGKESKYLGYFCPSLILDKTVQGFKKDKLRDKIRKGQLDYVSYEIDDADQIIRIKEVNSYGTIFETYIIDYKNGKLSITFLNGKAIESIENVIYSNCKNGIEYFYILGNSHLWEEKYTYSILNNSIISCEKLYYVPNLINSSKEINPGYDGSPAKKYSIELQIDKDKTVINLVHSELVNGKIKSSFVYNKKST